MWHDRVQPLRRILEQLAVGLDVAQQLQAEVVEGEFGERHARAEIFQVEYLILERKQLLVTVAQVSADQRLQLALGQQIIVASGGEINEGHARLDPLTERQVFIQVVRRPEVHHLHHMAAAADAVNPPEAPDDPHRVPVDVVVHQVVAVLEVLAFGDTVGGDQQVKLGLLGHSRHLAALLRPARPPTPAPHDAAAPPTML